MDDLTIVANTIEEMRDPLTRTLVMLEKGALKLKPSKCEFCVKKTTILNHEVEYGKIWKNTLKSKEVDKFKIPTSKKEVQQFLGFMNYFRPYIYKFGKIADPLYKLTGNKEFQWTDECTKAFEQLKAEMKRELALSFPDPNQPFFMECDASQEAIAAILYQEDLGRQHYKKEITRAEMLKEELRDYSKPIKSGRRIIEIGSVGLNEAQRCWPSTQRELYAIYVFLEKWRHYIGSQQIHIYTDSTGISSTKSMKSCTNRTMMNWIIQLQEYNYMIHRIIGAENHAADYLSRGTTDELQKLEVQKELLKEEKKND